MNIDVLNKIMEDYMVCPDCDNDRVGGGRGTLEVETDYFKRTCKCGFRVILMEEELEVYK